MATPVTAWISWSTTAGFVYVPAGVGPRTGPNLLTITSVHSAARAILRWGWALNHKLLIPPSWVLWSFFPWKTVEKWMIHRDGKIMGVTLASSNVGSLNYGQLNQSKYDAWISEFSYTNMWMMSFLFKSLFLVIFPR